MDTAPTQAVTGEPGNVWGCMRGSETHRDPAHPGPWKRRGLEEEPRCGVSAARALERRRVKGRKSTGTVLASLPLHSD